MEESTWTLRQERPPPFCHSPEPLQLQLVIGLFQRPGSSPALESDQASELTATRKVTAGRKFCHVSEHHFPDLE